MYCQTAQKPAVLATILRELRDTTLSRKRAKNRKGQRRAPVRRSRVISIATPSPFDTYLLLRVVLLVGGQIDATSLALVKLGGARIAKFERTAGDGAAAEFAVAHIGQVHVLRAFGAQHGRFPCCSGK
jgi:hypothetical protein